jgi:hypothetical protein
MHLIVMMKAGVRPGLVPVKKQVRGKNKTFQRTYHIRPEGAAPAPRSKKNPLTTFDSIQKKFGAEVGEKVREALVNADLNKPFGVRELGTRVGGALMGHGLITATSGGWRLQPKAKALIQALKKQSPKKKPVAVGVLNVDDYYMQSELAHQIEGFLKDKGGEAALAMLYPKVAKAKVGPGVGSLYSAMRVMGKEAAHKFVGDVAGAFHPGHPIAEKVGDLYGLMYQPPENPLYIVQVMPGMIAGQAVLEIEKGNISVMVVVPMEQAQAVIQQNPKLVNAADRSEIQSQLKNTLKQNKRLVAVTVPDQGQYYTPVEAVLDKGTRVKESPLNGGINRSYVDVFQGKDGKSIDAVWKPAKGEALGLRPGALAHDHYYLRERAVYEIDHALGFGVVPETRVREQDGDIGSVQAWVHNAETGINTPEWWNAGDPLDMARVAVLDYIVYNMDRHNKNFLVGPAGRMFAIDNGLSLPDDETAANRGSYFRSIVFDFVQDSPGELPPSVIRGVAGVDWDKMANRLTEMGFAPAVGKSMKKRATDLLKYMKKKRVLPEQPGVPGS